MTDVVIIREDQARKIRYNERQRIVHFIKGMSGAMGNHPVWKHAIKRIASLVNSMNEDQY